MNIYILKYLKTKISQNRNLILSTLLIIVILSLSYFILKYDKSFNFLFMTINILPCYLSYKSIVNGENYLNWCFYWVFISILKLFEEVLLIIFIDIKGHVIWNIIKIIFSLIVIFNMEILEKLIHIVVSLIDKYKISDKVDLFEDKLSLILKYFKSENKMNS